ncbi:MAG: hypothetical protein JW793_15175 [Acidobacteria bacterium]|nr:hypothetical protein [Acidobacteriota bacterium]
MPKSQCHWKECTRLHSEFSLFLSRRRPPRFENHIFCSDGCLYSYFKNALSDRWRRLREERESTIPRPKIGTILMQTAFITREQLDAAIRMQKKTQEGRLGEWLRRLGFVDEHQVTAALAKQYGLPVINLKNPDTNEDAVRMIPGKVAKRSGLIPVGFDDDQSHLQVAVSAPVDFRFQEAIRRMVRKGIAPYIGDQSAIQQLLERYYEPEELDLSNIPTYGSLDDLIEAGCGIVRTAIKNRALDIRAELIQDFFWMRLDYPEEAHHHFFQYDLAAVPESLTVKPEEKEYGYAALP